MSRGFVEVGFGLAAVEEAGGAGVVGCVVVVAAAGAVADPGVTADVIVVGSGAEADAAGRTEPATDPAGDVEAAGGVTCRKSWVGFLSSMTMSPRVAATPVNVATAAVTMIVVFALGRR